MNITGAQQQVTKPMEKSSSATNLTVAQSIKNNFDVLLTVQLSIILVTDQLNAQIIVL